MDEPDEGYLILGWDVGGTKSAAVVGTSAGAILGRAEWPSLADGGPDVMLPDFLARAERLRAAWAGVACVGVSIGGPLDTRTGTILSPPHLPGWDNVPLARILRRRLHLPATVEHDAAACLAAEWLWGAAKGCSHAAYLTCGTGCGAGILIDGRILRGPDGQSPEVGHVRLDADGPEMFGKAGCVESFCSGEGIGKLAPWMFPEHFHHPVDTRRLADLAAVGDAQATAVLAEAARRTGQLCALLTDVFCPQVIVLGSLARYLGDEWVRAVRQGFHHEVLPDRAGATVIVPAALAETLQDLSAIAPCVCRYGPAGPAPEEAGAPAP